ncbi:MAG: AAA family ATPase [Limnothrix sp. RL_2_0]|nr:AAA family ATPase [Limnothrix sp. RL_2_0]
MLTRLKISGFKNLVDVDLYFGAFTCIAGANGVGKSNLFDAIQFLSALSDRPLIDAAQSVRDESGKSTDIRSLFHRIGDEYGTEISFEAEMIIQKEGIDDLGQEAKASSTFLRYSLKLCYRESKNLLHSFSTLGLGSLEILEESLVHIKKMDRQGHLPFEPSNSWTDSIFQAQRRTAPFISTETDKDKQQTFIRIHQDSGAGGKRRKGEGTRQRKFLASNLPRTVLSDANATESPTVLLAKLEIQSWQCLQLEPLALRSPDPFLAPTRLNSDGSHLPATLYRLANRYLQDIGELKEEDIYEKIEEVYSQVANSLSELIDDIRAIYVDRDEKRQLLTLQIIDREGTTHPARSLSDGTLRFLALAVLSLDPEARGLICLEEPENGIHPERIPAILHLLQQIATDINQEVNDYNPLRQVIINTHSPAVVQQIPDDSLVIAEPKQVVQNKRRFKVIKFSSLRKTWRASIDLSSIVSKGKLLSYLNPVALDIPSINNNHPTSQNKGVCRVIDRPDMRQLNLFPESPE